MVLLKWWSVWMLSSLDVSVLWRMNNSQEFPQGHVSQHLWVMSHKALISRSMCIFEYYSEALTHCLCEYHAFPSRWACISASVVCESWSLADVGQEQRAFIFNLPASLIEAEGRDPRVNEHSTTAAISSASRLPLCHSYESRMPFTPLSGSFTDERPDAPATAPLFNSWSTTWWFYIEKCNTRW